MQKTLGPLIINIDGYKLTTEDVKLISHPLIGGIILFENNYESHQQVIDLIDNIKNIKNNLIISIDHEGGRVQRFKKNFTKLPSFEFISNISNFQERVRLAMCCGFITGYELNEIGVNLNYSPVIDILHPSSRLLKGRTFGSEKNTVITLSMSYIKGIIKAGVLPVLKHYPGHGSVATDSHTQICTTGISIEDLLDEDLVPFIEVLKNYSLPVMTNHVLYQNIDKVICSYSKKLLNNIPRDIFKVNPVFISDDLEMHAAKYFNNRIIKCEDRVIMALKAGCQYVICTSKLVENIDKYQSSSHYFTEHYLSENLLNYTRQNHDNINKLQFISRTENKMYLYRENLRLIKSYKYG
tara:strand:- start:2795 stop:3853 length:1059 start_codon:yes stop_codon:yes gene_type:complete